MKFWQLLVEIDSPRKKNYFVGKIDGKTLWLRESIIFYCFSVEYACIEVVFFWIRTKDGQQLIETSIFALPESIIN